MSKIPNDLKELADEKAGVLSNTSFITLIIPSTTSLSNVNQLCV